MSSIKVQSFQERWILASLLVLLIIAVFFVYAPVLSKGNFLFDDWYHLEFASEKSLSRIFAEFSPIEPESQAVGNVEWWCYWRLFHLNARPYFVTGLLLHVICILLIVLVSKELGLRNSGALIAGVWFGLNPVLVHTLSWIATTTEYPFALIFCMLTLMCFLRGGMRPKTVRWGYLFLSYFFYFLAIKAKMQSHFIPFLFLALITGKEAMAAGSLKILRKAVARSLLPQVPYWLISVLYAWNFFFQNRTGEYRLSVSLTNAMGNLLSYFSFFSIFQERTIGTLGTFSLAGLIIVGTIVLWGVGFRAVAMGSALLTPLRTLLSSSYIGWMWGWFAFLPVIFLVKHAEGGHLYLPLAGFSIFIGALIGEVLARALRKPALQSAGVVVISGLWLWSVHPTFISKLSWPAAMWEKNRVTISNLRSLYPKLPTNAHLYIYPPAPGALFDSGKGSSIRLIYGKKITVTVAERLDELGNAMGGDPSKTPAPVSAASQEIHLLHYDEESGCLKEMKAR